MKEQLKQEVSEIKQFWLCLLFRHFNIWPEEVEELLESLEDMWLLSVRWEEVRHYIWNIIIKNRSHSKSKREDGFNEYLARAWDLFSEEMKEGIFSNLDREDMANIRIKEFVEFRMNDENK